VLGDIDWLSEKPSSELYDLFQNLVSTFLDDKRATVVKDDYCICTQFDVLNEIRI